MALLGPIGSAFVLVQSLPSGSQGPANNQLLTQAIDTIRGLMLSQPIGNHTWIIAAWCIGIILVSVLLIGILYRRKFS